MYACACAIEIVIEIMCVCLYLVVAHNLAIRPCHPINSLSMLLALVLSSQGGTNDTCYKKPLIIRDKGTYSLCNCF